MNRPRAAARRDHTGIEDRLGRHWPVWVFGLFLYGMIGLFLLTKVRIPTPLHLLVMVMALTVLSVTAIRLEWSILALALILFFARPGISLGAGSAFHVSGFEFALLGVTLAYVLRYLVDKDFAAKGPPIRRTIMDWPLLTFAMLVTFSSLASFSLNEDNAVARAMTASSMKTQLLFVLWFYLLSTLLRTPSDLRRFVVFFGIAGLIVSGTGLAQRLMGGGAAITAGTVGENLEAGAGGRLHGGWLGLDHPNMFAALLVMSMPIWFFMVSHLRHGIRRLFAEFAVVIGFLGLLFTYSRSAWLGSAAGLGLLGLMDRASLKRLVIFSIVFVIAAQGLALFMTNMNLVDVVVGRIEEFQSSDFSARPSIYRSAFVLIREHPWTGVGLSTFWFHAPPIGLGFVPKHAHNVFLNYAAEAGIPAALVLVTIFGMAMVLSVRSVRRVGRLPGYGFLALGICAALIGLLAQMMAVQIFRQSLLGYGIYALLAIIVALDRMIREGQFDDIREQTAPESGEGGVWISS